MILRRFSRRRAEQIVAGRLAALGHDPAFLAKDALDELLRRAEPTAAGLRAALGATLFLASTEEAASIPPELVRRAVQRREPHAGGARGSARAARSAALMPLAWGAAALAACAAAAVFALSPFPPKPAPLASMTPAVVNPLAAATLRPGTIQVVAPIATPLPALLEAPPIDADLPGAPPPSIVLVEASHSPHHDARLAALRRPLQDALASDQDGLALPKLSRASFNLAHPCRAVCYYFTQDRPLAQRIAALTGQAVRREAAPARGETPPGRVDIFVP